MVLLETNYNETSDGIVIITPYSLSRFNLHNGYLKVRPLKLP